MLNFLGIPAYLAASGVKQVIALFVTSLLARAVNTLLRYSILYKSKGSAFFEWNSEKIYIFFVNLGKLECKHYEVQGLLKPNFKSVYPSHIH